MINLQDSKTANLTRAIAGANEQLATGHANPESPWFADIVETWRETFRTGQDVIVESPAIIGITPNFSRSIAPTSVEALGGACLRVEGTLIDTSISVVNTIGVGTQEDPRKLRVLMPNNLVDRSYKGLLIGVMLLTRDAKNVIVPISTPSTKQLPNGQRQFIPTIFTSVSPDSLH